MRRPAIALVEFSASHTECLYSQLSFLKRAGHEVHLIIPQELRPEIEWHEGIDHLKCIKPGVGFNARWACVFEVRRYLIERGIRVVVFNTAEGNYVRDFCITAPLNMRFAGTIHHTNKLHKSFTQRLISLRVRKYFVLNDYLLERIPRSLSSRVQSYYPIFFPPLNSQLHHKKEGEVWIGIPGIVEFRRRDYQGFLKQLEKEQPDAKLRFVILGKCDTKRGDGAEMLATLHTLQLESQFIFFPDFIPFDIFSSRLQACDCILPLIHPNTQLYDTYQKWQVSGAYNLAFGFRKPMLVHETFRSITDFRVASYFYQMNDMIDLMNSLTRDTQLLKTKSGEIRSVEKFSFEFQCRRYLEFLSIPALPPFSQFL